jgi:hypothetical protein
MGADDRNGNLSRRLEARSHRWHWWRLSAAGCAVAIACVPLHAQAADLTMLTKAPPLKPDQNTDGSLIANWLAMVSATQAAQPRWITPLVTGTARLEQEVRYDQFFLNQGNGSHIVNFGGGKGIEIVPTYNTEVILGVPPYDELTNAKGVRTNGFADWPAVVVKYRILSANAQQGDYILTAYVQTSVPTGFAEITNNVYVVQPTIAFGKGWGDFDFQATVSQQYAVDSIGPAGSQAAFGNPIVANVAFQYHVFEYFWPELEFNYTYWPGGTHKDLSQLLLTPGLILGRFKIGMDTPTRPVNLIVGAGYQFAVTDNPVTKNNVVATVRVTF